MLSHHASNLTHIKFFDVPEIVGLGFGLLKYLYKYINNNCQAFIDLNK